MVSGAVGHRSSSVGRHCRDDSGVGEGQAEGEDHELEHGEFGKLMLSSTVEERI